MESMWVDFCDLECSVNELVLSYSQFLREAQLDDTISSWDSVLIELYTVDYRRGASLDSPLLVSGFECRSKSLVSDGDNGIIEVTVMASMKWGRWKPWMNTPVNSIESL